MAAYILPQYGEEKEELVFLIMCLCDFQSNYLSVVTGIELFLIDSELGFCHFCQCVQVCGSYPDKHFQMF